MGKLHGATGRMLHVASPRVAASCASPEVEQLVAPYRAQGLAIRVASWQPARA